ncbi:MAG: RagB/SusD family nutrient uptake outer membrane protein [Bacteroidales bacterium]|nr:RagB/SusD family nutrient uptake outer membrane protein [Bacteroidales bacterium]
MKRASLLLKILAIVFFMGILHQSCTDLDEEVYSDLTGEKLFENPDNLIYVFGKAYTNLYWLVGHKYGMVGMDAGTDMMCVPQRGGDWYDGGEWHRWHRHTWSPTDAYMSHWWNILFEGVSTINLLLFQFQSVDANTDQAQSELRALRALYYLWLIDIYGNVPIIPTFDVPTGYKPPTEPRQKVFEFIESELTDPFVVDNLSKETGFSFYSRINYYAAQMILAKLYLNAEVYIGASRWTEALEACNAIIDDGVYSLEADYFENFVGDATSSPEHIIGVPYDQILAEGFEVHLFTLHYNLQDKYQLESGPWNGVCFQESIFNSFDSTDLRRNGLLSGPQYDNEGNQIEDPSYEAFPNIPFDPDGPGLNLTPEINMLEPSCLRQAGTRVAKWPFIEGSPRYMSNDFPIFRYADLLLMKAEILLRSGGSTGDAEALVNEVRARASADPIAGLTLEELLAERGRELYAEGHRRSDMIRFGTYLDPRWEKDEVSPDYVKLWPVPQSQIDANSNLVQNPGY